VCNFIQNSTYRSRIYLYTQHILKTQVNASWINGCLCLNIGERVKILCFKLLPWYIRLHHQRTIASLALWELEGISMGNMFIVGNIFNLKNTLQLLKLKTYEDSNKKAGHFVIFYLKFGCIITKLWKWVVALNISNHRIACKMEQASIDNVSSI